MSRFQFKHGVVAALTCAVMVTTSCQVTPTSENASAQESTNTKDLSALDIYQAAPNEAVIFYKRNDGNYEGWGLHLWDGDSRTNGVNELVEGTTWDAPRPYDGIHPSYGAYYVVPMTTEDWGDFMFIVHKGADKDLGGLDHRFNREAHGSQYLFTFEGVSKLFTEPHLVPPIAIEGQAAHWVDERTLAFNPGVVPSVKFFYSETGSIRTNAELKKIEGGEEVILTRGQLSDDVKAKFPHLADYKAWSLPENFDSKSILTGQLIVATLNPDGSLETATQVQKAGVLDALYAQAAENVELGANLSDGETTFRLWAPTAQSVELKLYKKLGKKPKTESMTFDANTGVWFSASSKDLSGYYYRYNVTVYHPETGKIETYEVTDPYSLSLSQNSEYSQVVDLNEPELIPSNWGAGNYVVDQPEQIVIYESHIRDFTLSDQNGSPELNGKYGAFSETNRASIQHLKTLQQAGLTHMHLLPSFDIATTIEFAEQQANIDDAVVQLCEVNPAILDSDYAEFCETNLTIRDVLSSFPADSTKQQDFMSFVRPVDNFNWGYDPYHYTVPEGSYASNAEGSARIREYRDMVQAIHDMDLNVVMDVVYNHTNQSGVAEKSVLDKIVPGYYHRLNPNSGAVENSTCCKNTATEHRMMEKLMIDSLIVWARDYHIDAFRFDLMGHHMTLNMDKAYAAVKEVRPHVYFYGEGWNFGEVANNARGENATQWNMAGTGVGTFSDRLRDAVRGGGPFDEKDDLRRTQGFGNGLYYLPNEMRKGDESDEQDLLHKADQIRVGLAGNLRDYLLINKEGFPAFGQDIDYNGQPAGYTLDPQENVTYVSKHDNQTLWDNNQYRFADYVTTAERVRLQNLGLATNMMAQGVPFFHMGSDLLRSKSMERDSYDSGDWFNAVDFTFENSTWARGLPRQDKDGNNWYLVKKMFANPETYSDSEDRAFAAEVFQEFLSIRKGSALFHMPTALAVQQRVDFHNTGPEQIPGVIAMSIDDSAGLTDRDPNADALMVIINASDVSQAIAFENAEAFELHPIQKQSVDTTIQRAAAVDGEFRVPGLSVAVFVLPQGQSQGMGVPVTAKDLSQMPPLGKTPIHLMGTLTSWETLNEDNRLQFVGDATYVIELPLEKGFYKVKTGNNSGLEFGKLGAFLKAGSQVSLDSPGGVMNLQLADSATYRFELNMSNLEVPVLSVIQK